MTKHQKIDALPHLNRRSFIVGTAATGLVLGYVAGPQLLKQALAAPGANFEPTAWYAIGNDGKVVVTVCKAEMGQHISSTMAQLIRFNAVALRGNPMNCLAEPVKMKLFFDSGSQDRYAEVYTNIDPSNQRAEIREKDLAYRKPLLAALAPIGAE